MKICNTHTTLTVEPSKNLFLKWLASFFILSATLLLNSSRKITQSILDLEWQAKIVLLCAMSVMVFTQWVDPFYVPGGDSFDYISTARYLLGQAEGIYSPWRTPGMAFFHILSGTVIFESWHGFIFLYALMSVLMPLLIYFTLSSFNRIIAFIAALLGIFSMIPYAYSRTVMSDHLFYFINFLSLFLIARFFIKPNNKLLYFIPLAIAFLNLVKPVAALYYWIFLVFAFFFAIRHRRDLIKSLALSALLYLLLMTGWTLFDRALSAKAFEISALVKTQGSKYEKFTEQHVSEYGNSSAAGMLNYLIQNPGKMLFGSPPAMAGRKLLGIYYFAPLRDPQFMNRVYNIYPPIPHFFSIATGPSTAEMKKAIEFYVRNFPDRWENNNPWLSRFKGNPEGLIQEIYKPSNVHDMGRWEQFYWESLTKYYGIHKADKLFRNVALELLDQYPATFYLFWENILKLTLGFPDCNLDTSSFSALFLEGGGDLIYNVRNNYLQGLSPGLKSGLKETITAQDGDAVRIIPRVYSFMHGISPLFVIATCLLLPFFFLNKSLRYFSYLLLGLYLYNIVVIAVFGNFSCPRYKDVFVLFPMMLTCLGVYAFFQRIKQKGIQPLTHYP